MKKCFSCMELYDKHISIGYLYSFTLLTFLLYVVLLFFIFGLSIEKLRTEILSELGSKLDI